MAVTDSLIRLPEFKKSKSISIYLSMVHGEISTDEIIKHSHQMGKKIYVPFIDGSEMFMFYLHPTEDPSLFVKNKWGIPQPSKNTANGILREEAMDKNGLDLIIIPGIAFDRNLNRLGHGKGYYDKYLAKINHWSEKNNRNTPLKIGLALNEQLVDTVPINSLDIKLDILLLQNQIIR
ncbi:5-formyltetrahydrofolate cyclo-ligase [Pneumocystis carinii B80]|uniref:5-formyltetrahydrofolate cyclo-ligase n=1 Tax=Pneumocystis carinii (strain B80) TaxID=1408658 RepID=A0A0W4ZI76_PNEC8|nr:5-formyltetrahydrofolate cyclo-ligase [Pneumocystis carinii B80]KTW28049.1 5-formyltetrahydrofolate cyclo-ligase [Pneumocystis carinii B80]